MRERSGGVGIVCTLMCITYSVSSFSFSLVLFLVLSVSFSCSYACSGFFDVHGMRD